MPGEVRYSLFPLSDAQLQRQPSRRASSRPRTADRRPANGSIDRTEHAEVVNAVTAPPTDGRASPSRPSTSSVVQSQPNISEEKALVEPKAEPPATFKGTAPEKTAPVQFSLPPPPTIQADVKEPLPKQMLSRAPSAAGILPSAYKLDTTTRSRAPAPFSRTVDYSYQYKHKRNNTGDTSMSSATATTKPSPTTPETASSTSLFSPITPADSATTSPIKYPTVPRLSSSPPPMSIASWSPPRRSNTRTTNTSQSTFSSQAQSHHTHTHTLSSIASARVPANLQRSSSRATATTQRSNPAPPAPFVSIFPTFNEDAPLDGQEYSPNVGYWQPADVHPVTRPQLRTMSSDTSSSALSEANLARLESTYAKTSPDSAAKSKGSATLTGGEGTETTEKRICALVDEPQTIDLPLRSKSVPQPSPTPTDPSLQKLQQPAPFFPPPPQPKRTPSKKRSKSAPAPKKIQKAPPKSRSGLFGKNKQGSGQVQELDFSWTGKTSVKASFDEKQGALTMKTTTVALVPPGHPLHDGKKTGLGDGKKGVEQPLVLNALRARPGIKMGGGEGAGTVKVKDGENKNLPLVGKGGVAELSPEDAEWGEQAVQHSVSVALGAVAFVMGVGVEVAGGMVGGLRRKKGSKDSA